MLAVLGLLVLAQAVPSAPASPSPQPTQTPTPLVSVAPDFALYDLGSADVSDGLLNFTLIAGKLRANATLGTYAFPVVGFPLEPDNAPGVNVELYSPLPVAALTYQFDSHVSVAVGKFGS